MTRATDPFIPANEELYRSISAAEVIGQDVQPWAVELPRCSFNRASYCTGPESVLSPQRPEDTGVVAVTPGSLPGPVPRAAPSTGKPYEFVAADDPHPPEDPANAAHAEVRLKPQGELFNPNHKIKNKELLAKAKDELAKKLRIVLPPR
jgi:hypothetical protein